MSMETLIPYLIGAFIWGFIQKRWPNLLPMLPSPSPSPSPTPTPAPSPNLLDDLLRRIVTGQVQIAPAANVAESSSANAAASLAVPIHLEVTTSHAVPSVPFRPAS